MHRIYIADVRERCAGALPLWHGSCELACVARHTSPGAGKQHAPSSRSALACSACTHAREMPFGQVVIGPPGCGKSTFCLAATDLMRSTGRQVCIVNLDPANDALPYECDIDVADLVSLDAVQQDMGLGPNGGLAFCMDYLLQNFDWLQVRRRSTPTMRHSASALGSAELLLHVCTQMRQHPCAKQYMQNHEG